MNDLTTILFDLDDTLIIEWDSARNTFIETVSDLDISNKNEFVSIIREEARLLWYKLPTIEYCLKVGISSWEALWADFTGKDENLIRLKEYSADYRLNAWNNALLKTGISDIKLAKDLSDRFKLLRNQKHILFPDTIPCLNKLKNKYKLGLITNGAPDIQWKKIEGGKLSNYFNPIIISGEYGTGKPDPFLFEKAFNKSNSDINTSLFIGDSLGTDIEGAIRIGLKCIWLNRDNRINNNGKIKPDFELKSLTDLDKFIVS